MNQSRRIVHLARSAAFLTLVAVMGPYESRSATAGTLQVWDCETLSRIVVRPLPQAVEMRLANRVVTLPRSAGTEERYGNDEITFWSGGTYARIEESGSSYICRNSPGEVAWEDARSRGIEVRAAGEEPEWSLEIDEGAGMEFVTDSGATRVTTPAPVPEVDPVLGRTTYSAATQDHVLIVVLEGKLCWYKANGMASSATVTVILDETKVYRGCGRPLPSGNLVGTVEYRLPKTLPGRAEMCIQVVRLSGPTPTREVVGEYRAVVGNEGQIRFQISYDRERIYGGDTYGLETMISVDGKPRVIGRKVHLVLTRGNIATAAVRLDPR